MAGSFFRAGVQRPGGLASGGLGFSSAAVRSSIVPVLERHPSAAIFAAYAGEAADDGGRAGREAEESRNHFTVSDRTVT
jgi:hypothetical protein